MTIIRNTAYIVSLDGNVYRVPAVAAPRSGTSRQAVPPGHRSRVCAPVARRSCTVRLAAAPGERLDRLPQWLTQSGCPFTSLRQREEVDVTIGGESGLETGLHRLLSRSLLVVGQGSRNRRRSAGGDTQQCYGDAESRSKQGRFHVNLRWTAGLRSFVTALAVVLLKT